MVCSSTGTSAEGSRLAGWRGTAEMIQTGDCYQDGMHENLVTEPSKHASAESVSPSLLHSVLHDDIYS